MSYEQNNFGALAWIVETSFEMGNGAKSWIKMPVVKHENGYQISNMMMGVPQNGEINLKMDITKNEPNL